MDVFVPARRTWPGRSAGEPCQLLARVEEALRVERPLDCLVQLDGPRRPLLLELPALQPAGAVFARDRAAEPYRQTDELLARGPGAGPFVLALRREEERRVEVAVAGVAEAEPDQVVTAADLGGLVDRLLEPVQRDDDVLAERQPAPGKDGERQPAAPAPELFDPLAIRGRVHRQGSVAERLDQLGLQARRLRCGAVGLGDHEEPGALGQRAVERAAGARKRFAVQELD